MYLILYYTVFLYLIIDVSDENIVWIIENFDIIDYNSANYTDFYQFVDGFIHIKTMPSIALTIIYTPIKTLFFIMYFTRWLY